MRITFLSGSLIAQHFLEHVPEGGCFAMVLHYLCCQRGWWRRIAVGVSAIDRDGTASHLDHGGRVPCQAQVGR